MENIKEINKISKEDLLDVTLQEELSYMAPEEVKNLAIKIREAIDNKKGEDIEIIEIGSKTTMADYMVIASASNERLLGAIVNDIEDILAKAGIFPRNIEGKKESGWILMDYIDIIINVLTKEMREKYQVEKVWLDCEKI